MRDEELRSSCFLALDALRAQRGDDLPYADALDQGFAWRNRRVPFLNYQKGIYRAAVQQGPAALSLNTSFKSPYDDEETDDGFLYAYRDGPIDQPDNHALRAAHELGVWLTYFVGTRPGWYRPVYPVRVIEDRPFERRVVLAPDRRTPSGAPRLIEDKVERRYAVRATRVRLHQARFRGLVLPAYHDQCAICRLKEIRLLDAAHIIPESDPEGDAAVTNGLSLCTIHHRAYDEDLVGVDPGYRVHVSRGLLEDDDGPMLDLLKGFHRQEILVPRSRGRRPDRERLAARFDRFLGAG